MKKYILIIAVLFFFSLFRLFAHSYFTWLKEDYSSNLCKDEKLKLFYEDQLKKTFNDDSIKLYQINKVDLSKFVDSNVFHVYLSKFSERHFKNMGFPIERNSGYCILNENNQLINLWKNSKEIQKLIKAAELSKCNVNNKKEFLDFIYSGCMADDKGCLTKIIDSFDDMCTLKLDKSAIIKYRNLKDAIKITDTHIEFYVFIGGLISFYMPDLVKVVLTFDEDNGVSMQETILEKRIPEAILP